MRTLFFLSGLVIGAFALLIAQNLGLVISAARPAAPRRAAEAVGDATREARSAAPARESARVAQARASLEKEMAARRRKSLEPLAVLLEDAIFQQDWNKVEAAAEAIVAHGSEWTAAPPPPPSAPVVAAEPEEMGTAEMERTVRRRREEAALQRRTNRAIEIARAAEPGWTERLLEIVRAEGGGPADPAVRTDAAWLLARSGDERAVRELVRLLSDPREAVRRHAAKGLAMEDYASGLAELVRLARPGGDAEARISALTSLGEYGAVERGEAREALAILLEAARGETDPRAWNAAIASLARVDFDRFPEAHAALVQAIGSSAAPGSRGIAASAATHWRAGDERVRDALRAICRRLPDETDPATADAFLRVIAEVGDASCEEALARFAATPLGNASGRRVAEARERILGAGTSPEAR